MGREAVRELQRQRNEIPEKREARSSAVGRQEGLDRIRRLGTAERSRGAKAQCERKAGQGRRHGGSRDQSGISPVSSGFCEASKRRSWHADEYTAWARTSATQKGQTTHASAQQAQNRPRLRLSNRQSAQQGPESTKTEASPRLRLSRGPAERATQKQAHAKKIEPPVRLGRLRGA